MRRIIKSLCVAALAAVVTSGAALAQSAVQVGKLSCDISGGLGLIIASQKTVNCTFEPRAAGWMPESYSGSIDRFGLDIGGTTGAQMAWVVFAAGSPSPGALGGSYAGATAEATLAVGLGANVLVGGSRRSIALQPLSLQGQTGLNVAAGVAVLRLSLVQ